MLVRGPFINHAWAPAPETKLDFHCTYSSAAMGFRPPLRPFPNVHASCFLHAIPSAMFGPRLLSYSLPFHNHKPPAFSQPLHNHTPFSLQSCPVCCTNIREHACSCDAEHAMFHGIVQRSACTTPSGFLNSSSVSTASYTLVLPPANRVSTPLSDRSPKYLGLSLLLPHPVGPAVADTAP